MPALSLSASKEFEMGFAPEYIVRAGWAGGHRSRGLPCSIIPLPLVTLGLAAGLISAAAIGEAGAQHPTAVLVGTVTNTAGQPLPSAQIVIPGTRFHALSQRTGHFRIDDVPIGSRTLEVHFVGHQVKTVALDLVAGEVQRHQIVLEVSPVELAPVEASSVGALSASMQGFYHRRTRATGHFFTHEQISSMQARAFTDILRRVPGATVRTVSGPQGGGQVVSMGRTTGAAGNRSCDAVYYVNGMPFPVQADIGINAYIRPHDIEALEIYSGASRIPSEFNTGMRSARCGVVVIWTRSGPLPRTRGR